MLRFVTTSNSENGCRKWHFGVWNRVRIRRAGRHTPHQEFPQYPPPGAIEHTHEGQQKLKKKGLGLGMSLGSVSHEVDYLRAFKGTCSLQPSYVLLHTVSIKASLQMLIGSLIVIAKPLHDRLVFVFGCFMSQDTLTTSVTLSFIVYFSRVSDWGRKNYHESVTRNFNQPQYTSRKDTASISYHATLFRFSRD